MEYLKRVAKILRESNWATMGTSLKLEFQAFLLIILVGGVTFGLDALLRWLLK